MGNENECNERHQQQGRQSGSFLSSRTTQFYHYYTILGGCVCCTRLQQQALELFISFHSVIKATITTTTTIEGAKRPARSSRRTVVCVFVSSLLGAEQQQQQPWRRPRPLPRLRALVSREPCSWMKWPFICILSFVSCWHWEWHGFVVPFPSTYSLATASSQPPQLACRSSLALSRQQQKHQQQPPLTLGFSVSLLLFVASTSNRNQRQFSGLLSATLAGFLTYTYLEPIFVQAGSDTAMVFLYLLVINAIMVGMGLGVLLPKVLAGVSFACAVTIFVGAFWMPDNAVLYFPVAASGLAVLAAVGCVR